MYCSYFMYCEVPTEERILYCETIKVRVWDMRGQKPLYMRHAAPARRGQSSPVWTFMHCHPLHFPASFTLKFAKIYVHVPRIKDWFLFHVQVYSMGMDASNLYVALDQSLNHFGFGQRRGEEKGTRSTWSEPPARNNLRNNNRKRNTNARWQ